MSRDEHLPKPVRFLRDNSLSIAFWLLFALCLGGEAITGHMLQRADPKTASTGFLAFIGGSDFLKGVFGNWQAALLQLFALIVFAVFLRQRGASHSRKCDDDSDAEQQQEEDRRGPVRRGASWLYGNSLSLAFLLLFLASFVAFFVVDLAAYTEQRAKAGEAPLAPAAFLVSAKFWFDVLQTWQAEFMAMGVFLILSIFLRQDNSAESKPVWATDDDTGDTNH
jgi:hypothetical protein